MKLDQSFYINDDTLATARQLLGKELITCFDGFRTSGIILETEAYLGETDKACHAYNGRRTNRTETMYLEGGVCYIYLCYGIHHLLNIVVNEKNIPHAILIRAIAPKDGLEYISTRRKGKLYANGPGMVTQALGIETKHNGLSLIDNIVWIEDNGIIIPEHRIKATPRVGIEYAEEDALKPYRFLVSKEQFNI